MNTKRVVSFKPIDEQAIRRGLVLPRASRRRICEEIGLTWPEYLIEESRLKRTLVKYQSTGRR